MDEVKITKQQALAAFNGNGAELGRALGLTRQAIAAWPDGPIAEGYALKLRFVLKPEIFGGNLPPAANDDAPPSQGNGAAGEGR